MLGVVNTLEADRAYWTADCKKYLHEVGRLKNFEQGPYRFRRPQLPQQIGGVDGRPTSPWCVRRPKALLVEYGEQW